MQISYHDQSNPIPVNFYMTHIEYNDVPYILGQIGTDKWTDFKRECERFYKANGLNQILCALMDGFNVFVYATESSIAVED